TAVYCVIVPFLYWAVDRKKPQARHIAAALLCLTGVGLVSLQGGFSIATGDLLTLLCGVFYAAHIVTTKLCTRAYDFSLLTALQFITVALLSLFSALLFDTAPQSVPAGTVGSLLYLAVMATAAALWLQSFGQKYTAPAQASLLLSLEAVFGVLCSMVFYGDRLTPRLALGFLVIFLSVLTSARGLPSFRHDKKEREASA
ncbi:MAG TPA: DMT family transporter, partial [Oscillospiraceae bacterium]|nr:DMT family transporter [Oscillospiraceae bacterium]